MPCLPPSSGAAFAAPPPGVVGAGATGTGFVVAGAGAGVPLMTECDPSPENRQASIDVVFSAPGGRPCRKRISNDW